MATVVGQSAGASATAKQSSRSAREEPFQLKGTSFKMMVLRVIDPGDPRFFSKLEDTVRQAPAFFGRAPIALDFGELGPDRFDLPELLARIRGLRLVPVGVVGGTDALQRAAVAEGLAMMPQGRGVRLEPKEDREEPRERDEPREREEPRDEARERPTLLITEPVRSGRQVYAAKADLVIVAPVGAGSEILADGHIHVYDTLRGRALAGLSGDRSARIFCRKLEAELVSIAGLYKVSDDIDQSFWKANVQIYLEADKLCVSRLG